MVTLVDKLIVISSVVTREVGREFTLIDFSTGDWLGLDAVGERIWRLVEEGRSGTGICDAMMSEYDVDHDTVESDVLDFLQQLEWHGFLAIG